jgi:hypothetical protein
MKRRPLHDTTPRAVWHVPESSKGVGGKAKTTPFPKASGTCRPLGCMTQPPLAVKRLENYHEGHEEHEGGIPRSVL